MKCKIIPIDVSLGSNLDSFWDETVEGGGVRLKDPDWEGGLRFLGPSKYEWDLVKRGQVVNPVEIFRSLPPYEVFFNELRALKIGALPKIVQFGTVFVPSVGRPCPFYCTNKTHPASILNRPTLGLNDPSIKLGVIPQGFPAVKEGHCLLVPAEFAGEDGVRYPHVPQRLHPELLAAMISVAVGAKGWRLGWNDLGSGGSVPHAHAQLVRVEFSIEKTPRIKVGDHFFYPYGWAAGCLGMENADAIAVFEVVKRFQQYGHPVNLLISGRTVFIYARRRECELVAEFPTNIMAFMELSGHLLAAGDKRVFDALTETLIAIAMRRTTLSVEEMLAILG